MSPMKKIYFSMAAAGVLFTIGCSDSEEAHQSGDLNEETMDETRAELAAQLEESENRREELEEEVLDLREENLELKDDVLTYKQQVIDQQQEFDEDIRLRTSLQQQAKNFFHAMHERNMEELEELTGEELLVEEEEELFRIEGDDKSGRSFHFMQLDRTHFVYQRGMQTSEDRAVAEYEFYAADEDTISRTGIVELTFEPEDEDWNITSIAYIN
ncbi:MAG: hypothetical protein EA344_09690 [Alkalicoccus sp.]|nr:MAG: hypothetical protein EA344_09690 [Alkalicoccus sp.]